MILSFPLPLISRAIILILMFYERNPVNWVIRLHTYKIYLLQISISRGWSSTLILIGYVEAVGLEKVARGTTIGIVKLAVETLEWLKQIRSLVTREFTGRLEGVISRDNKEAEFVLEVRNGKIVGAWLRDFSGREEKGEEVLDSLFDYLREVQDGYIEVVELDENGVALDLEYNQDIMLGKEVSVDDLLDSLIENKKLWRIEEILEEEKKLEEKKEEKIVEKPVEEKREVEEIIETEEYKKIIEKLIPESRIDAVSSSEREYARKILNELSSEANQVGKGQDRLFNVLNLLLALSKQYERPLLLVSRINDEVYVMLAENGKLKGAYRIDELSLQILDEGSRVLKKLSMMESVPYTIYEVEIKGEGVLGGFKKLLKKLFGGK